MSEPDASETDKSQAAATDESTDDSETGASADGATLDSLVDDSALLADILPEETLDDARATEDIEITPDEELIDRIADTDAEDLATDLTALKTALRSLQETANQQEETIDSLESRLKRTQADFQNYKKRMKQRREEEKQRATEDLVERLVDVRDNLRRALDQDADADIRDGVEATLRQFDEELERENVSEIMPEPGAEVDPQRHEVLLRVESDQPEGTIDEVSRPGYEMAEKVIRTAQVTVSEGPAEETDDEADAETDSQAETDEG